MNTDPKPQLSQLLSPVWFFWCHDHMHDGASNDQGSGVFQGR
jgi:hypothetical protein